MRAIRYSQIEHEEQVKKWFADHRMHQFDASLLPEIGFIVPGVCAGWLYQTDSKLCLFENVISNKEAHVEDRKCAVDLLSEAIIREAKERGFKIIAATTNNLAMIERAKKFNFSVQENHSVCSRRL